MLRTLKPVILLLALALLVQNTCPHGYAGKSSVASACDHCPMKKHFAAPSASAKTTVASVPSSDHFPLYVFAVQKPIHTFQLEPVTSARTVLANCYEDALPNELLRPPQA